jgi:hypothetical protein
LGIAKVQVFAVRGHPALGARKFHTFVRSPRPCDLVRCPSQKHPASRSCS